jgi:hypothetical protein
MHKIFGSTVQNLVTWPTTRPEFVHPWCILTVIIITIIIIIIIIIGPTAPGGPWPS